MNFRVVRSNSRKLLGMLIAVAAVSMTGCNGQDDKTTAGITTIGNTVAGLVVTNKGTEVPNAEVRLIPADYDPVGDSLDAGFRVGETNARGIYAFENVAPGSYNLEAIHDGTTSLLQAIVLKHGGQTMVAPNAVLANPGIITIIFGKLHFAAGGHFYIPGTTRFVTIDSAALSSGSLAIPYVAPAQYLSVNYQAPSDSKGSNLLDTSSLNVESDKASLLDPLATWKQVFKVSLNTGASGADVATDVKNFPVLVRLSAANFDFANARADGGDVRAAKQDGTPLDFEIERWDSASEQAEIWVKVDTVYGADAAQYFFLYSGSPTAATRSNGAAVFDSADGFVGVWHMGGTGARSNSVAGGQPAVPYNFRGNESRPGLIGLSDSLGGGKPGSYLDIGDGYDMFGGGFTFSVWIYPTETSNWTHLLDLGNGQEKDNVVIQRVYATSSLSVDVYDGSLKSKMVSADSVIAQNRWQQFAVTAKGNSIRIFKDGVLVHADTLTVPISSVKRTLNFLGKSNWAADSTYSGLMDEPSLSKVERDADWIKLSYENQKADQKLVTLQKAGP